MLPATLPEQDAGLVGWVLEVIDRLGEIGVGALVMLESVIPPIPSEEYHVVAEHVDLVNSLIYLTIGAALAVFVMRRLYRRRADRLQRAEQAGSDRSTDGHVGRDESGP